MTLQTINTLSYEQIAALTGAQVNTNTILPNLTVNRMPEDEEGTVLPMGHFTVSQGDIRVYGPKAIFRPFINAYQYSEYSPTEKKFINRSIIIKSFTEEALDMLGGLACGKIPHKRLPELSAQDQLRQKQIKCRRLVYGLVTIPNAVTKDKIKTELVELPALWKLAGGNFMAPEVAFKSLVKLKHPFFQHNLTLATKRHMVGTTIIYDVEVEVDFKNDLEFTADNMDTFTNFQDVITRENNYVSKCWREAKQADVKQLSRNDLLASLELNDSVDDL